MKKKHTLKERLEEFVFKISILLREDFICVKTVLVGLAPTNLLFYLFL